MQIVKTIISGGFRANVNLQTITVPLGPLKMLAQFFKMEQL